MAQKATGKITTQRPAKKKYNTSRKDSGALRTRTILQNKPTVPITTPSIPVQKKTINPYQTTQPEQNLNTELPFMAKQFTSKGEPWYGAGAQGWIRRSFGKMFDPKSYYQAYDVFTPEEEKQHTEQVSLQLQKKYRNIGIFWDTNLANITGLKYSDLTSAIGAADTMMQEGLKQAEGKPIKQFGVGLSLSQKVIKRFFESGTPLTMLGLPFYLIEDYAVRKPIAAPLLAALQMGDISLWLKAGLGQTDLDPEFIKKMEIYQEGSQAVYTLLASELLPVRDEKFQSFLTEAKEREKEIWSSTLEKDYPLFQAQKDALEKKVSARAIYDGWLYNARTYEFLQRALGGEDPDFLALEYQNPWIELAGSLIFDPTNLIPFGAVERGSKMYSREAKFGAIVDEVGDALNVMSKTTDNAVDAVASLDKYVESVRITAMRATMRTNKYATDFGPSILVASGKRAVQFEDTSSLLKWIVSNSASMDDAVETIAALAKVGMDDPEAARLAAMTLSKRGFMTTGLLSDAAFDAGAVLRNIIGNGKWIDKLEEAAEAGMKSDELIKFLDNSVARIVKNMYPSIDEMEEAAKALKAAQKLGTVDSLPQATKTAARMLDEVSPTLKFLNKAHRVAQNKLFLGAFGVRQVNEFFAHVYLGYSAGYAARNLQNNVLTIFFDQGPQVAADVVSTSFGDLWTKGGRSRVLASQMEDVFGFNPLRGVEGKTPATAVRASSKTGPLEVGLKAGQSFELSSRTQVVYSVANRRLNKFLESGAYLPDMTEYIQAGKISLQDVETFKALMIQFRGKTDSALEAMKVYDKAGFVKTWELIQPNARLFNYFQDTGMLEAMMAAQRAATPDEFLRLSDDIIEQVVGEARRLAEAEPPLIPAKKLTEDPDLAEFVANVEKLVRDKAESDIAGAYLHSYRYLIGEARNRAAAKYTNLAHSVSAATGDTSIAKAVGAALNRGNAFARADRATDFQFFVRSIYDKIDDEQDLYSLWRTVKFKLDENVAIGSAPELLTPKRFKRELWDWYHETVGDYWARYYGEQIDGYKMAMKQLAEAADGTAVPDMSDIDKLLNRSFEFQNAYLIEKKSGPIRSLRNIPAGATLDDLDTLVGQVAGKVSKEEFPYTKPYLLNMVKKDRVAMGLLQEGEELLAGDVKITEAIEAIQRRTIKGMMPGDDWPVTLQRATAMSWETAEPMFRKWQDDVVSSWGKRIKVTVRDPERDKVLTKVFSDMENRTKVARLVAVEEGKGAADFALLSYNKLGIDVALQYIFPYEYWYRGSYANWARRFGNNPAIIANYMKYRRFLENLHAGLPDWYKYQLNTGDIGLDLENPMFFNLEATINPLNGLTGVDFTDPYKRVDWLTSTVDDLGKFGPSIWTPYNWAIAVYLQKKYGDTQDEKYAEASKRWMGRLFPQSTTLKAVMAGVQNQATKAMKETKPGTVREVLSFLSEPRGLMNKYNEFDPFVAILMGGLDPYELRRANRWLAYMVENGEITEEEQIDLAWSHHGPMWDKAVAESLGQRAFPNLASFFLGTGYKPRTQTDMMIDEAYGAWYSIRASKENVSPDRYREMIAEHFKEYPWFEGILIGSRSIEDRNVAYTYNVLSRIPPGRTGDAFDVFGIDSKLVNQFYQDKGFKNFNAADRDRFMATVMDLATILALPDFSTKREWDLASQSYGEMRDKISAEYGETIWDKISGYYGSENKAKYRAENPDVVDAMIRMNQIIVDNNVLYKYYGSLTTMYYYYDGVRFQMLTEKYGARIYEEWNYYVISGIDKKNWPDNVLAFLDEYGKYSDTINDYLVEFGTRMPDYPVVPQVRKGVSMTDSQELLLGGIQGQPTRSAQEIYGAMPEYLQRLVRDYIVDDADMTYAGWKSLDKIAEQLGVGSSSELLQILAIEYYR